MSFRQDFRRFAATWKLWAAAVIPVFLVVMGLLMLFGVLGGCATVGPSAYFSDNGTVLNLTGYECPKVVNAEAHRRGVGCYLGRPVRLTFDPTGTDTAHELDHQHGMRHGDWVAGLNGSCAEVLASGSTPWIVGRLICKEGSSYVQR